MVDPKIDIYWDEESDTFFLWHFGLHNNYPTGTGNPQAVDRPTMQSSGIDLVLQSLEGFSQRPHVSPTGVYTGPGGHSFSRAHRCVDVSMPAPDLFVLTPWKVYKRGAMISDPDHAISVPLPCVPQSFFDAIVRAFSLSNTIHDPAD